ncbi:uncharacterized protein CLUP02_01416 [Colletotrichum lupini]|uniref:Uncharacterized protein n=1 Tax=Colletotrichum lupini TaxID=145971 RepID=A0A9Q8SCB4_9PEZI|nr:uncharacterized protein CLUP02_01416 [Colletotrichum lupini]UQC74764.1 hypothetical protein CLUP02_01416 [Colletotrichum lupini]
MRAMQFSIRRTIQRAVLKIAAACGIGKSLGCRQKARGGGPFGTLGLGYVTSISIIFLSCSFPIASLRAYGVPTPTYQVHTPPSPYMYPRTSTLNPSFPHLPVQTKDWKDGGGPLRSISLRRRDPLDVTTNQVAVRQGTLLAVRSVPRTAQSLSGLPSRDERFNQAHGTYVFVMSWPLDGCLCNRDPPQKTKKTQPQGSTVRERAMMQGRRVDSCPSTPPGGGGIIQPADTEYSQPLRPPKGLWYLRLSRPSWGFLLTPIRCRYCGEEMCAQILGKKEDISPSKFTLPRLPSVLYAFFPSIHPIHPSILLPTPVPFRPAIRSTRPSLLPCQRAMPFFDTSLPGGALAPLRVQRQKVPRRHLPVPTPFLCSETTSLFLNLSLSAAAATAAAAKLVYHPGGGSSDGVV